MSFAPDGSLLLANDLGEDARSVRVAPGGASWEFIGTTLHDPEGVLADPTGRWSGTPGSVLVACGTSSSQGVIYAIHPDNSTSVVVGPLGILVNASYVRYDSTGNLLVDALGAGSIVRVTGSASGYSASVLLHSQSGGLGGSFAVDQSGAVYYSTTSQGIQRYSSAGVYELTIPTVGTRNAVAVGPGGPWGNDFYFLDRGTQQLVRVGPDLVQHVMGAIPGSSFYNMEFGPDLALYVALHETGRIYRITCLPGLTSQPVSNSACSTGAALFSVNAASADPLTYQWQVQTSPGVWQGMGNDPAPFSCGGDSGAYATPINSPTVTIGVRPCPSALPSVPQHFKIRCVVTNACGSVTSNEATYTTCPADVNCSGSVSVQDIFDFLAAYFAGNAAIGDFNQSGTISVQDIFDFLGAYFAGCA